MQTYALEWTHVTPDKVIVATPERRWLYTYCMSLRNLRGGMHLRVRWR
jgi:hypothetical protein